MKISIFVGDLCDAPAEALCTSTNPRLSLYMGTGGSVRTRGGFTILRSCEAIVEAEFSRSGNRHLPAGSAHVTAAGELPAKVIIHCVASNARHQSSPEIVRACVINALRCAGEAGCTTIALPVFASGHAGLRFDRALRVIVQELRDAGSPEHPYIVFNDPDRIDTALGVIRESFPDVDTDVEISPSLKADEPSTWFS
ncbi:MAG TPA: macro domain-containing protein [Thermoanaerobaculia bacterium]|nr:macro domain-containing protein [Thermoanaerobaculia bacterium]